MNVLADTNESNITVEEYKAVKLILNSARCGILARNLCNAIVDIDTEGAAFLTSMIPGIVQRQSAMVASRLRQMQSCMSLIGRMMTGDTVKSGSRKGKPAFMTDKFAGFMKNSAWYSMVYVYSFANFMESARQASLNPDRFKQLTVSTVISQDDLARSFVDRFRKFLDDLETKDVSELVSITIFDAYPGMEEFIQWCRDNRKTWDNTGDAK